MAYQSDYHIEISEGTLEGSWNNGMICAACEIGACEQSDK